jgi:hypothetical protein
VLNSEAAPPCSRPTVGRCAHIGLPQRASGTELEPTPGLPTHASVNYSKSGRLLVARMQPPSDPLGRLEWCVFTACAAAFDRIACRRTRINISVSVSVIQ